jgi:hypothetical protein
MVTTFGGFIAEASCLKVLQGSILTANRIEPWIIGSTPFIFEGEDRGRQVPVVT